MNKKEEKEEKIKMPQISVSIPETVLDWLDKAVNMKIYGSKAEIIRIALRDFIAKESSFIQNLQFDLEKLNDIHKKYIEFRDEVNEKISPKISNIHFINE